ncbi:hypothetical protein DQ384_39495 [Sphaerisporangium album]|uniref:Uncharacterized protein n=1 Tax=Sphaerisporangium album TaxID=509200 RepID=A0A367EIL5_9ACTN|nr:hypothetical protein [Sphaerisporangium album]RCG17783.1 hypothetical protein DQ384_39495 [Sphaerisporangium album]
MRERLRAVEIITIPGQALDDDRLGRLTEALPGAALAYNQQTGTAAVHLVVDATSQAQAVRAASRTLHAAARDTLGQAVPFAGIRLAWPGKDPVRVMPELVGITEIAALLGAL